MSFLLNNAGTTPQNLAIKAVTPYVLIGDYRISLLDLLMAQYVLENTDLEPEDPRRIFVEKVRRATDKPGWNRGRTRLQLGGAPYPKGWKPSAESAFFAEVTAAVFQPRSPANQVKIKTRALKRPKQRAKKPKVH